MNWFERDIVLLENSLNDVLIFAAILVLGILFKRFGAKVLSKQSFRIFKAFSHNQFSEVFVELLRKPVEQFIMVLVVYFAFERLKFPEAWNLADINEYGIRRLVLVSWQIAFFTVLGRILLRATDFFTHVLINRQESPVSPELGNFLKELIKVVLVVLCVFAALRFIFHVNITALVASLGIGGLAVALAAQDTLANLLGSFIIYLDKPFKAGDLIETGDIKGKVEHVGFRTTRIRTLEKSLLTVPNKKLIDSALNNITLSDSRRVRFELGLTYKSSSEQILGIVEDVKAVLAQHSMINEDFTVRFSDFSSSSLNILVVYFVNSNEYDKMIEVKEFINVQVMAIVEKHGCEFAYPTQTVYVNTQG